MSGIYAEDPAAAPAATADPAAGAGDELVRVRDANSGGLKGVLAIA